jgi:hypothetical protein
MFYRMRANHAQLAKSMTQGMMLQVRTLRAILSFARQTSMSFLMCVKDAQLAKSTTQGMMPQEIIQYARQFSVRRTLVCIIMHAFCARME